MVRLGADRYGDRQKLFPERLVARDRVAGQHRRARE